MWGMGGVRYLGGVGMGVVLTWCMVVVVVVVRGGVEWRGENFERRGAKWCGFYINISLQ